MTAFSHISTLQNLGAHIAPIDRIHPLFEELRHIGAITDPYRFESFLKAKRYGGFDFLMELV